MEYTKEEQDMLKSVEEVFKAADFGESFHITIGLVQNLDSNIEVSVSPVIGDDADSCWVLIDRHKLWILGIRLHEKNFAISDWELQVLPTKMQFLVRTIPGGA